MKKKIAEHLVKSIPSAIKNAAGYIKENFDENGQEILDNSSGTAGLLIKLLGKPLIDKYFQNLTNKKLEDFGFNTYLKASLEQVNLSVAEVIEWLNDDLSPDSVLKVVTNSLESEVEEFNSDELILLFRPKYHPLVYRIRKSIRGVIDELSKDTKASESFVKHFNENIEKSIAKEFGDDYENHLKEIEQFLLEESESKLLWDTIQLAKIGFKENERLVYQDTYAQWLPVSDLISNDNYDDEDSLVLAESLVDDYFDSENNLNKILFLIADFGKGKSVFLKNYASKLAKSYIKEGEGLFPIYFNLRNFKNYSSEPPLGVLYEYLLTDYGIKINDEYFRSKKFIFLIDSLDESGELNKKSIEEVISSIKSIQGIDKLKYRDNRIVISSRPFDDGLEFQLKQHSPHLISNEEDREVPQFVGIYGFKKSQFNDWMTATLNNFDELESIRKNTLGEKIYRGLKTKNFDLHSELIVSNTLSESELRRPIFAYMIYQLVIHNVDFLKIGKIGIYLSFLNLLTREAKPYYDKHYEVDLSKELEFRNLLHAISSLWVNERQRGRQGILKKADICRVVEGSLISENDSDVLDKNRGEDAVEIHFLSHSYFGENNNVLHFQHQSFAEILLAEYYLKVFIKYALDNETTNIQDVRSKLFIGEPTEQTIQFLTEMLDLLVEVSRNNSDDEVLEKRRLLFPLVASMAVRKNNQFFCNHLFYSWFKVEKLNPDTKEAPVGLIERWPLDEIAIGKIVKLCSSIINSKSILLLSGAESKSSLIKNELVQLNEKSLKKATLETDKWLALKVGNVLLTNTSRKIFFNKEMNVDVQLVVGMIEARNYTTNVGAPIWAQNCFMGLSWRDINFNCKSLNNIDFSFGNFDNVDFEYCSVRNCNFSNSTFCHVHFEYCDIQYTRFDNIEVEQIKNSRDFEGCFSLTFLSRPEIALHKRMCNERIRKTDPKGLQLSTKAASSQRSRIRRAIHQSGTA
jgi:hypothetical protein